MKKFYILIFIFSFITNAFSFDPKKLKGKDMQAALKTLPSSVLDSYKAACGSGHKSFCLPEKCISGDMKACNQYAAAARNGFKIIEKEKAKSKIMIKGITKEDQENLAMLKQKCDSSKKRNDCNAYTEFYKQVLSNSCKKGIKSNCAKLSEIKREEARLEKATASTAADNQENTYAKIQEMVNDKDVDGLKSLCFTGEKYACRFVEKVQKEKELEDKAKAEKELAEKESEKTKRNQVGVNAIIETIDSIDQEDGLEIEDIEDTENSVKVVGTYKTWKSVGNYIESFKKARIEKLKIPKNSKSWRPEFKKDPNNKESGFIIEFKK